MSLTFYPSPSSAPYATSTDVTTGTDPTKLITSANLTTKLSSPGAIGNSTAATSIAVDNLSLDGNTLSTTNTNGDLTLSPNGSGLVALVDKVLSRPEIKDYAETVNAISTPGSDTTTNIDLELGNVATITLGNYNATFAFTNPSATGKCCSFTFFLTQYSTAKTVTWPAAVKWPNNTAPTISGNSKKYVFSFFTLDAGTTWYGSMVGDTMGG